MHAGHQNGEPTSATRDETTRVRVGGMHCASCVGHVERALRRTPGVSDVSVNFATEEATVRFDPGRTNGATIAERIREAGYRAEPVGVSHVHGGHRDAAAPATHEHHHGGGPAATPEAAARSAAEIRAWRTRALIGIAMAAPVFILGMFVPGTISGIVQFLLTAVLQVYVGAAYYRGAWNALRHARADMDTLVAVGTSAAFLYSVYTLASGSTALYFDTAAAILALIALGKWMEARARGEARRAIASLLELRPPSAFVEREGGVVEVPLAEIVRGDVVHVRPGGRVPVDGTILDGSAVLDESMVTGESMPVEKAPGSTAIGGTLNQTGSFRVRAERLGSDSLLGQVVRLVDEAQATKTGVEGLADRAASVFVPAVLVVAALTLLGWGVLAGNWSEGTRAMIAVLIVACPCALGLAVPTAVMVGSGIGARRGILIKDAAVLERAGTLDTVVLDKTGTLTVGRPEVTDVVPLGGAPENELLALAAAVERDSEHPLGQAIVRAAAARGSLAPHRAVSGFRSTTGAGVEAVVDGRSVHVGKPHPPEAFPAAEPLRRAGKTVVAVGRDGAPLGLIALADPPKPGAREVIEELHRRRLRVILLTGDHAATAESIARDLGIDEVIAGVLPQEKEAKVGELRVQGRRVAMVGDGVNDAPALAAADVGIAMGSGADIAKEAGDVVLVSGDLWLVPRAIELSRAMMGRIRLGLFWAFIYNLVLVPLAALGWLHPMLAASAMALSSVSVVVNALTLKWSRPARGPAESAPTR